MWCQTLLFLSSDSFILTLLNFVFVFFFFFVFFGLITNICVLILDSHRLLEHGYVNLDKVSTIQVDSMDVVARVVGLPIQDMITLAEGALELRKNKNTPKVDTKKWRDMIKSDNAQSFGRCSLIHP